MDSSLEKHKLNKKKTERVIFILCITAIIIANSTLLIACDTDNTFQALIGKSAQEVGKMPQEVTETPQPDTQTPQTVVDNGLYNDGKFMCGICHPPYGSEEKNAAVDMVTAANIGWTRFDISDFPYEKNADGGVPLDEDGNVIYTESYAEFRARCAFYASKGLRVMAVTPYPEDFFKEEYDNNIDVTEFTEADKALMREYAAFYATDLKGIVQAFQITNEQGQSNFRRPLATAKLAAEFIGIFAEAMHPIAKENGMTIGYNIDSGAVADIPSEMQAYSDVIDWVGLDIYLGCFESFCHNIDLFNYFVDLIYNYVKKPIILCEFGYINKGAEKTDEEKTAILQKYGYNSESEVRKDIEGFINAFERVNGRSTLVKEARARLYDSNGNPSNPEAAYVYLFKTEKVAHIYCEISSGRYLTGYPHTKQGQADFFSYLIPQLYANEHLAGMFIYCFKESDGCYVCKQADCPIETAWGLVETDFTPNLSYYAVQKQYGLIKAAENDK